MTLKIIKKEAGARENSGKARMCGQTISMKEEGG